MRALLIVLAVVAVGFSATLLAPRGAEPAINGPADVLRSEWRGAITGLGAVTAPFRADPLVLPAPLRTSGGERVAQVIPGSPEPDPRLLPLTLAAGRIARIGFPCDARRLPAACEPIHLCRAGEEVGSLIAVPPGAGDARPVTNAAGRCLPGAGEVDLPIPPAGGAVTAESPDGGPIIVATRP